MFLWINRYYSLVKSKYVVTLLLSLLWQPNAWTKPRIRNSTSDIWQLPFPVRFHNVSFFMQKNSIDCSPFYPVHNLFDPYSSLWVKTKSFMLCSAADKTENSSSGIRAPVLHTVGFWTKKVYVLYSQNGWDFFFHFYDDHLFSADRTQYRNSNFDFFAHEILKKHHQK